MKIRLSTLRLGKLHFQDFTSSKDSLSGNKLLLPFIRINSLRRISCPFPTMNTYRSTVQLWDRKCCFSWTTTSFFSIETKSLYRQEVREDWRDYVVHEKLLIRGKEISSFVLSTRAREKVTLRSQGRQANATPCERDPQHTCYNMMSWESRAYSEIYC